ncbi:MAG: hypothetical protein GY836_10915, partial [Herbaspirillum sp.]|uniref:hypothetical protein n=1 Tax=Herbaspirillum sp. TaxID=1890675 RepID=UPI00258A0456
TVDTDVIEPHLQHVMDANVTAGDAGDHIEYTITVYHTGASTSAAFDIILFESFWDDLLLHAGTVIVSDGRVHEGNTAGDTVMHVNVSVLPLGHNVTVRFVAELTTAVRPDTTVLSNSSLSWWSVPGTEGRERSTTADAPIIYIPTTESFGLLLTATNVGDTASGQHTVATDLAVGEHVSFVAEATLREGTTATNITLRLPSENQVLGVVSSRVLHVGHKLVPTYLSEDASGEHEDAQLFDGIADTVIFNFGDVVAHPNNIVDEGDRIRVEVIARVENVVANADGVEGTTEATLEWQRGKYVETVDTDVIEPHLQHVMDANVTAGDAGDHIEYTITVYHTGASTSAAFDI